MNCLNELIKINCEADDYLSLAELVEFQGELKYRNENDYKKIIDSIKTHGFSFPFFVWKDDFLTNYVLDGHGRLNALRIMEKEGVQIPKLPVVYVKCKSKQEAKQLLLKMNSQYGKMTKESVIKFVDGDVSIDLNNFELPSDTMLFSKLDVEAFKIPTNPTFKGSSNPMFLPTFTENKDEIEMAKINNNNIAMQTNGSFHLHYGAINCVFSQNEYDKFKSFYDDYVEKNKTNVGVINEIFRSFN